MPGDEDFLRIAIDEAQKASWPFGAVIVKDGEVIAQAGSGDGKDAAFDPTAHAETNAIRRASAKLESGDLSGSILYGTCEPCAQCFGAAWYAGIRMIVFGCSIEEIIDIEKVQEEHLVFPRDHIAETGMEMRGGVLKNQVIKMYASHPRLESLPKRK